MGLPGCTLYTNILVSLGAVTGPDNSAVFRLTVPPIQGLMGERFYHQALLLPSQASLPQASFTGALEGRLGGQL